MAQKFFILAVVLLFGYSSAENANSKAERLLNHAVHNLEITSRRFDNIWESVNTTRSQSPPKLIPNIRQFLNDDSRIKSLRESLDEVWPKFWKVAKRKECAKLLDKKLDGFVAEFDFIVKQNFDATMFEMYRDLSDYNYTFHEVVQDFKYNNPRYVKNCVQYDLCDNLTDLTKYVREDLEDIEYRYRHLYETLKENSLESVNGYIKNYVIPAIDKCLDD